MSKVVLFVCTLAMAGPTECKSISLVVKPEKCDEIAEGFNQSRIYGGRWRVLAVSCLPEKKK